jgi:hypothetical protein
MKSLLTSSIGFFIFLIIISCITKINSEPPRHILKEKYYQSGKIKAIIAYNNMGLKDSISSFYNESGKLDSSIEYSNGKLNGRSTYHNDYRTIIKIYKDNSLICFSAYDFDDLAYQYPLDTNLFKESKIRLLSGRNYFDKTKSDTLLLVLSGIPRENRMLSIYGGAFIRLSDTTWAIRNSDKLNKDSVIISIGYSYYYNEDSAIPPTVYKSIHLLKK